jgi:hypothetical protein
VERTERTRSRRLAVATTWWRRERGSSPRRPRGGNASGEGAQSWTMAWWWSLRATSAVRRGAPRSGTGDPAGGPVRAQGLGAQSEVESSPGSRLRGSTQGSPRLLSGALGPRGLGGRASATGNWRRALRGVAWRGGGDGVFHVEHPRDQGRAPWTPGTSSSTPSSFRKDQGPDEGLSRGAVLCSSGQPNTRHGRSSTQRAPCFSCSGRVKASGAARPRPRASSQRRPEAWRSFIGAASELSWQRGGETLAAPTRLHPGGSASPRPRDAGRSSLCPSHQLPRHPALAPDQTLLRPSRRATPSPFTLECFT